MKFAISSSSHRWHRENVEPRWQQVNRAHGCLFNCLKLHCAHWLTGFNQWKTQLKESALTARSDFSFDLLCLKCKPQPSKQGKNLQWKTPSNISVIAKNKEAEYSRILYADKTFLTQTLAKVQGQNVSLHKQTERLKMFWLSFVLITCISVIIIRK